MEGLKKCKREEGFKKWKSKKKRDEDVEKKEFYIYICVCVYECMREVLDEEVVAACEEMGLWVSRG